MKLSWNSIGDAGMAAFAAAVGAAPALTELRLDANRIGDAGATALAHALAARPTPCGLRILSFGNERGGNAIGDDGLVALVEVLFSSTPELRELGLSNNRIGTAGATALANALSLGGAARCSGPSCSTMPSAPPASPPSPPRAPTAGPPGSASPSAASTRRRAAVA